MATDNKIIVGKIYQSTTTHRAIYLGDRTNLFNLASKKELVSYGDTLVVLQAHQISDTNVYDLYVLTKTGNLGWTRGMLFDDLKPMISE